MFETYHRSAVLPVPQRYYRWTWELPEIEQYGCYSVLIISFAVLTFVLSFYSITGSGRQGGSGTHYKRAAKRSRPGKDVVTDDEPEIMPEKTTRR